MITAGPPTMPENTGADCIIIGFNDGDFTAYADQVRALGEKSGGYRDLRLALVHLEGRPRRALEVLSDLYFEDHPAPQPRFHNTDFLWPAIAVLGSALNKNGLSFDYVNIFQDDKDRLRDMLKRDGVVTVAITTTLYVVPDPIIEIIEFVRRHRQDATIVVGGPFVSSRTKTGRLDEHRRTYRALGADIYVTSNEGETALVNVVKAIKAGGTLGDIPNIVYRQGDEYIVTRSEPEYNPLEANFTDYSLFKGRYGGHFLSTRTAKSCPFACAFCGFPQRAGKYKYLSVEDVGRELDNIRAHTQANTITFIDDTFNVPARRFKEVLRMMIDRRYGFRWNAFYRADHGDSETIGLMAEAGCEGVFLGIESGSENMLKRMNKTATPEEYSVALRDFTAAGISTYASLIVGFPGETKATVRQTIEFIEKNRPDFYRAQLWYCDPVTPVWASRTQFGITGQGFWWSHATMDATQAAQLIDEIFLSVEGSTWLPQWGFEQWSTFYLRRHGFSWKQIKSYVRAFNAAVTFQMMMGPERPLPASLLGELRAAARAPKDLAIAPVDAAISPPNYKDAVGYWMQAFDGCDKGEPEIRGDAISTGAPPTAPKWVWLDGSGEVVGDWTTALELFARQITDRRGRGRLPLVVVIEDLADMRPLPVLLNVDDSTLDLPTQVRAAIERGRTHAVFAKYVLTETLELERSLALPLPFAFIAAKNTLEHDVEDVLGEYGSSTRLLGVFDGGSGRFEVARRSRGRGRPPTNDSVGRGVRDINTDGGQHAAHPFPIEDSSRHGDGRRPRLRGVGHH